MGAEIFSVGTELLLGQTIDTNAAFLAQKLSQLGIDCLHKTTVGDNPGRLIAALQHSLGRSDIIIATGGLGPSEDDITAAAVAQALEVTLRIDKASVRAIKRKLAERGIPQLPSHLKQAQIPRGSRAMPNPVGTAPGFIIEKGNKVIISLPGPPVEMHPMFEQSVVPYLRRPSGAGGVIKSRVLHLMGIGESLVEEKVRDLIHTQANPTLAPLAGCGEVRLRITAKAEDDAQADSRISPLEAEIRRRLGDFIVGADAQQIENTVSHMLRESGLTLAVAESCSGGLISHRLTNIPGASDYLVAGLVCYSNPAKTALLGVKEETFAAHGAVSEAVALEMAEGVRKRLKADIGLSTTGIAGPTGGRPAKPVGLVYIAVSSVAKKVCEEHRFRGERESIKHQTANAAFNLLRKVLESGLLSQ